MHIAAGLYHSLAITEDGSLYSWGDGEFGGLGLGNENNQNKPRKVAINEHVVAVAAGYCFSMALTKNGSLFVWG